MKYGTGTPSGTLLHAMMTPAVINCLMILWLDMYDGHLISLINALAC